nr:MAG TPA: hypothetical protein [Microviridae sp.]
MPARQAQCRFSDIQSTQFLLDVTVWTDRKYILLIKEVVFRLI